MTQSPSLNCWCTTCRPPDPADPASMRLALCPTCGNKRCPRAHNHTLACTNSNAPGQPGSSWEHVRPVGETVVSAPRLAGQQTAADRELLELAAKAAGIAVVRSRLDDPACQDFLTRGSVRNPSQDLGPWSPLADDGNYTLPEAPVPAVPPTTTKPRTPSNGCHNRAPFKASTELRDHYGRLVTSWPFRMASDCQYTLSDLGQADKACHGCCWRREPMAECTETPPSS